MSEKLEANQNRFSREAVDAHHGQLESRICGYCQALDLPYGFDREDGWLFIDLKVLEELDERDLLVNMKRNLIKSWLNLDLAKEALRFENNPTAAIIPTSQAEKFLDCVLQEPDRLIPSLRCQRMNAKRSGERAKIRDACIKSAKTIWQDDPTLSSSEVARRAVRRYPRDDDPSKRTIRKWIAPYKPPKH